MVPIVSILLVLAIPGILQAGFDQLYNLMNLSTRRVAYVTDIYVLRPRADPGAVTPLRRRSAWCTRWWDWRWSLIANRISKSSYGHGIW